MRDIKFQCIDLKDKIIWQPLLLSEIIEGGWELDGVYYEDNIEEGTEKGEEVGLPHKDYNFHISPEDVVWREYTGLKDKNGVEIYEGDVLSDGLEVRIKGPDVILVFNTIDGKGNNNGTSQYPYHNFKMIESEYKFTSLEIIGNIYENPNPTK